MLCNHILYKNTFVERDLICIKPSFINCLPLLYLFFYLLKVNEIVTLKLVWTVFFVFASSGNRHSLCMIDRE